MFITLSDELLLSIRAAIASIGVLVIIAGALHGVYQLIQLLFYRNIEANYIRLQFGNSVILGLEFMVGADIVGSLVKPDYYSLGLLGIIVAIRTVLSFFLSLELRTLSPHLRKTFK